MPEFRSLGHSGSDLLTLSSSGFDPKPTSAAFEISSCGAPTDSDHVDPAQ